ADPVAAHDDPGSGKVRSLYYLHQLAEGDLRIGDHGDACVDDLAQVVRRHVRRHADGDPTGPIDQEVRKSRRQDDGFELVAVVIRDEIDGFLLDVAEELHGQRRQTAFRVSRGARRVAVDRAEVS